MGPLGIVIVLVSGGAMHVALYGWRAAPRHRVHLSRKQQVVAATLLAVLITAAAALFATLENLMARWPAIDLDSAFITAVLSVVPMVYGMAPSYAEDEGMEADAGERAS